MSALAVWPVARPDQPFLQLDQESSSIQCLLQGSCIGPYGRRSFAQVLTRPDRAASAPISLSFLRRRGRQPCSPHPLDVRPLPGRTRTRASSPLLPATRTCRERLRRRRRGSPPPDRDAPLRDARERRRRAPRSEPRATRAVPRCRLRRGRRRRARRAAPRSSPECPRAPAGLRSPPRGGRCSRRRDRAPGQPPRLLRASYNSTAAATLTLSESTLPASGIETIPSHARRTSGRRPRPSAPSTKATPPSRSAPQSCVPSSEAAPQTQRSGPFTSVRKRARFGTTAIGRCSTAPADARETAGVTRADPCEGTITPVAPAPSALRTTAPRLCGSVTWSRHTSSGESTAASAYASA